MLYILCPGCNQSFSIDESTIHAFCPNPNCPVLVHFSLFTNRQIANNFMLAHQPEYKISLSKLPDLNLWYVSYYKEPITRYITPSLSKLVNEEILQSIQAGYADFLGGPFTLFEVFDIDKNRRVEPLERRDRNKADQSNQGSNFRNFTEFCNVLRTHEADGIFPGDLECRKFDLLKVDELVSTGRKEAGSHICWCGFVEFTVPIIVDDKILGVIFTGQKRHKDPLKQAAMKRSIKRAAKLMVLDEEKMTELAFGDDAGEVDDEGIEKMKAELHRIALQLQVFADNEYRSQREIREQEFLDSLNDVFTEAFSMVSFDPKSIGSLLETVLKGVRLFTSFPLSGIFLNVENDKESIRYMAGNLWSKVGDQKPIILDPSFFHKADSKYKSLTIGLNANEPPLSLIRQLGDANPGFCGEKATAVCLVPIISTNCRGVLILIALDPKENPMLDIHYINSDLGKIFLKNLGHTLGEHIGICLGIAKIKNDQDKFLQLMISLGHEINTPLTGIIADSENLVIEFEQSGIADLRELAQHNLGEVERLHLLTENMMNSLGEKTIFSPSFTPHSIYRPLKSACTMFESEAKAKGCDIIGPKSGGEPFPVINMSLPHMTMAFKNFISNAVKYSYYPPKEMEAKRFIRVTGKWYDEKTYSVSFQNYGVGITEEEIQKRTIFLPHVRGKLASDRGRKGGGLGLAYASYAIENLHHGRIELTSEKQEGGAYLTIFTIFIPAGQAADIVELEKV